MFLGGTPLKPRQISLWRFSNTLAIVVASAVIIAPGRSRYSLLQILEDRSVSLPVVPDDLDAELHHAAGGVRRDLTRQNEDAPWIALLQGTMQHHLAYGLIQARCGLIGFDFNQMRDPALGVCKEEVDLEGFVGIESQRLQFGVKRVHHRSVIALALNSGCQLVLLLRPFKFRGEGEVGIPPGYWRWRLTRCIGLELINGTDIVADAICE